MAMTSRVVQKLRENVTTAVEQHRMFDNVKKAIIAFSAGPDSVCLLDVLHSRFAEMIGFELVYVNHGLRSRSVLAHEEELTRDYAAHYGMRYKIIAITVKKAKEGIEASARAARYRALLDQMNKTGAERIVLGHNLDDFVETFLLNLIRGSGLRGFGSIPAVRLPFVRPLINCRKSEVLQYLKVRKLPFLVDETNLSVSFRRNLLRLKILPILEEINPKIHGAIKREVEILRQDDNFLWELAEKAYHKAVHTDKDGVSLDLSRIVRYNPPLLSRLVMKAVEGLLVSLDGFESKHYQAISSLIDKEPGKKIALPKGLYAQRERKSVFIGYVQPGRSFEIPIEIGKHVHFIGGLELAVRIVKRWNHRKIRPDCEVFDLDKIELPLYIRNRKDGDSMTTKIGKKKLKKIFSERHVMPRKRGNLLLLCDQKGILWILGVARAFRCFVGKETKRYLVVDFERTD
jgi:tRNA(Ile)-lysidine synthase